MKRHVLISIVACFMHHSTHTDPEITLFFKAYPELSAADFAHDMSLGLRQPGMIDRHHVHGILRKPMTSGIFSTYAGYLNVSDSNGQTAFPRKHSKPLIYLIITTQLTPIIMTGNTIHHWELETGTPAVMYKVERKYDKNSSLFYWQVDEVALPKNNIIPHEGLVIFAKPQHVYVPTGATPTYDTPNLVLPDIYIKQGIKILASTLYVLNIKELFAQEKRLYEKQEKAYERLLVP
jgi:hypothetical protein